MRKQYLLICFVTFFSYLSAIAQHGAYCGFDAQFQKSLADKNQYKIWENANNKLAKFVSQNIDNQRIAKQYKIPVVVHIVSEKALKIGDANYLTTHDIEKGIENLNLIFSNSAPFDSPIGVNTDIQFCFVSTYKNLPTNGITRDIAPTLFENKCNQASVSTTKDTEIRNVNPWDSRYCINIWLVPNLVDECGNCTLQSYTSFPFDNSKSGIVIENQTWLHDPKALAHEMGHYFQLYHTFHNGCKNDDCTLDGDQVCDTPPDSEQYGNCIVNSCNTDTYAPNPNPFSSDVQDDNSNIMDFSECAPFHFTAGQSARMANVLQVFKQDLANSTWCKNATADFVTIDSILLNNKDCISSFCPKIRVANKGKNDVNSLEFNLNLNGLLSAFVWNGTLKSNTIIDIQLPCQNAKIDTNILTINTQYINNNLNTVAQFDNGFQKWFVGEKPQITNVKSNASYCIDNGKLLITASKGKTPYIYMLQGIPTSQTKPSFTGLSFGPYNTVVVDANMCSDTLPVLVQDSCQITPKNDFIVNGNASLQAGGCITLTEAQKNKVGSVWYKDKISLKRSFDVFFSMNLGCNDAQGADGFAFVLQPISTSIGTPGAGLGYQGINPSISVEFDTWANSQFGDPAYDHTSINIDGELNHAHPFNLAGPVPILGTIGAPQNAEDCKFHKVRISWNATTQTLTSYVDCVQKLTYTGDLIQKALFGISDVYLGFTASTGAATNKHQVCFEHVSFLDQLEDKTICEGSSIQIGANKNFATYDWSPKLDIDNNKIQAPKFFPKQTTTYFLKMSDACNFSIYDTIKINVINPTIIALVQDANPCAITNDNLIKITSPNAADGFQFSFNGNVFSNTNTLNTNQLGLQTLYAKKGNCVASAVVNIDKKPLLTLEILTMNYKKCNSALSLKVKALGGKAPFQYKTNLTNWQSEATFENLPTNVSSVSVKDENGCETSLVLDNASCSKVKYELVLDSSKLVKTCFDTSTFVKIHLKGEYGNTFYSIDNQRTTPIGIFTNIKNGKHTLYAKSDEACFLDSLIINIIDKTQTKTKLLDTTICEGTNVKIANKIYTKSGFYRDTLKNIYGCDSIFNTKLFVKSRILKSQNITICNGDFYGINNKKYFKSNIYIDTLTANSSGCDSIVTTNLKVIKQDTTTSISTTCDKNLIKNETFKLKNKYGCDSIYIVKVGFKNASVFNLTQTICEEASIKINGKIYDKDLLTGSETFLGGAKNGCDSVVNINLTISQIEPVFEYKDPICYNSNTGIIEIKNIKTGNAPYELSFNKSSFKPIQIPYIIKNAAPGISGLVIKDKLGCQYSTTFFLKNPKQNQLYLGATRSVHLGDTAVLSPTSDFKIVNATWKNNNSLSCLTCINPVVSAQKTSIYSLTATDINGCISSDSIKILVTKGNDIYVPNSFSPNGDNLNDVFSIFTRNSIQSVNDLVIFDRWGEQIYGQAEVEINDTKKGWDGTFRGKDMPSDVYTFYLKANYIDGTSTTLQGDFFLMR